MTRVIEPLIDNCSHFELNLNRRAVSAVFLRESGIVVARGRAKATSRTAPWLKWLLGAGALALPDELARQVLGTWRPTE